MAGSWKNLQIETAMVFEAGKVKHLQGRGFELIVEMPLDWMRGMVFAEMVKRWVLPWLKTRKMEWRETGGQIGKMVLI